MTQYSGVYTLQAQGQAITSGQWATDPYYRNTTLLLHADGVANGAQNNTFIDTSPNIFTINNSGTPTQGSFTPYGPTWSNSFNGSASYLQAAYSADFSFGTGDFTIEGWWFINNFTSAAHVITFAAASPGSAADIAFYIYMDGSTNEATICNGGSYYMITGWDASVKLNTWQHFAFVRQSGTTRLYINGVQVGTASANVSINNDASWTLKVGAYRSNLRFINGNLSNVSILKGTCKYPSGTTFFPSATPLATNTTNQVLLTCASNGLVDSNTATTAKTITVAGTPSVQRFSPFAPQYQYTTDVIGASGYYNGSSYTYAANSTAYNVASGADFTLEGWVYVTNFNSAFIFFYGAVVSAYAADLAIAVDSTGGHIWIAGGSGAATQYDASFPSTFPLNTWVHWALVRSGGGATLKAYLNGVGGTGVSAPGAIAPYLRRSDLTSPLWFGQCTNTSNWTAPNVLSPTMYATGTRFVNGTAVYSSNFTPPTTQPTAIANTQYLMNYANAGISDSSMMNNMITVGNAQVSTSVVKYGSGSLAFDGSGDYLSIPPNTSLLLNGGAATVECWVYLTRAPGSANSGLFQTIFSQGEGAWYGGGTQTNWTLLMDTTNIYFGNNFATIYTAPYKPPINTWIHIAAVKTASNSNTIYINGVSLGTQSCSDFGSSTSFTNLIGLGYFGDAKYANYFQGYIDDFRITKGVARYTSNFQPPKVAFANQ